MSNQRLKLMLLYGLCGELVQKSQRFHYLGGSFDMCSPHTRSERAESSVAIWTATSLIPRVAVHLDVDITLASYASIHTHSDRSLMAQHFAHTSLKQKKIRATEHFFWVNWDEFVWACCNDRRLRDRDQSFLSRTYMRNLCLSVCVIYFSTDKKQSGKEGRCR